MKEFLTINQNAVAELVEKKSRFIANAFYVESEEDVQARLTEIKKKYYDAKHHCYAYRFLKENNIIERSSDDGEPSGTAGSPILSLLQKNNLQNTLIIVTRYFGGTLLGTGGLVRAYSQVSTLALEKAGQVVFVEAEEVEVEISYSDWEQFQYFCKINHIPILKVEYLEKIKILIPVTESQKIELKNKMSNLVGQILPMNFKQKKYVRKNADI